MFKSFFTRKAVKSVKELSWTSITSDVLAEEKRIDQLRISESTSKIRPTPKPTSTLYWFESNCGRYRLSFSRVLSRTEVKFTVYKKDSISNLIDDCDWVVKDLGSDETKDFKELVWDLMPAANQEYQKSYGRLISSL